MAVGQNITITEVSDARPLNTWDLHSRCVKVAGVVGDGGHGVCVFHSQMLVRNVDGCERRVVSTVMKDGGSGCLTSSRRGTLTQDALAGFTRSFHVNEQRVYWWVWIV
jgi:hypothetical protein